MRILLAIAPAACFALASPSATRAEHARISLDVSASGGQVTASVDQTPPEHGKNPRPVIKARAGEPIKVQFLLTNVYPHKTLENVVVHFYVAREQAAGQKPTPDLGAEGVVVMESAFEVDLKPGAKAGTRAVLRVDAPGSYLVRIETRQTPSDHEHFAAVDLVVEGPRP